ncbi:acetyltransferase [Xanthomonas bromi]|uniref:Acetyltransferase n=1 Tax=Xanthomonas bromi TaxID=56449 RepID=A0A1C3NPK3_9XANT|nr:acetyltransferase [Xanthomonas bromi]
MTVVIETLRLRLRTLDPEHDADAMLELVNDPGFIAGINDRGIRTREQARAHLCDWAQAHHARYGFSHWAVETREDAQFIGTLGLLCRETLPVPHIGFALLPAYRGKRAMSPKPAARCWSTPAMCLACRSCAPSSRRTMPIRSVHWKRSGYANMACAN